MHLLYEQADMILEVISIAPDSPTGHRVLLSSLKQ